MKPHRCDVYFFYKCDCGAEYQQSIQEVKRIGKILCTCCGRLLLLDKIISVKVEPLYENKFPIKLIKSPAKQNTNVIGMTLDEVLNVAQNSLFKLGYNKTESRNCITKIYNQNTYNNLTDFYQACIKECTSK